MLRLEALFPILDVILAATLSAWFLAFASTRDAHRAIESMRLRAERVRMGAMFIVCGMFVNIAALAAFLVGHAEASIGLDFVAYPFWIAGATGLASATWAPSRQAAARGVEA